MTDYEKAQLKLEQTRVYATLGIAAIVIVGGMVMIGLLLWAGTISGDAGLALLSTLIGAALLYVFNKDATQSGAKASEKAAAQGAALAVTPYPQSDVAPPQPEA